MNTGSRCFILSFAFMSSFKTYIRQLRKSSETSRKDATEEKQPERDNGVVLTQMRRFLGHKIVCFNLQSGRYVWGLRVFWIIYILLKLLQLLQEASLISYRLVKERKKKGDSNDSSSLWPRRWEGCLPVGSSFGGLIGITCDTRASGCWEVHVWSLPCSLLGGQATYEVQWFKGDANELIYCDTRGCVLETMESWECFY